MITSEDAFHDDLGNQLDISPVLVKLVVSDPSPDEKLASDDLVVSATQATSPSWA